ncbi:MAG TPA: prepilin-type N-terminal cleavage/methylation domain-containing protein, partial [Allocoleopsis sp.]
MKRIICLLMKKSPKYNQNNYGFTLIEIIVVMMIIGILAAVMAPSWLAFTNRQRLAKANEAVLNAIRETQNLAKTTKQNYTMIIRQVKSSGVNQNLPEVAIYRTSNYPDPPTISNPPQPSSDTQLPWKKLGSDLSLNQRQFAV